VEVVSNEFLQVVHESECYHPNPLQSTSGGAVYMMQIQYRILSKLQLLDNRRVGFCVSVSVKPFDGV
jgi:hypothetical protein